MRKIDFEAHFYTEEYIDTLLRNSRYPRMTVDEKTRRRKLWYNEQIDQPFADGLYNPLMDLGEKRIERMDECGIDVQVLSLSAPGVEQLDPSVGTPLAKNANDTLSEAMKRFPGRIMGYAALAPKDPLAAAGELERCARDLGFCGWNTHSNYGDSYLDDARYRPILRKAEELGVSIYIHPTVPLIPQVTGYGFALAGAPFGFGVETALCVMRLIYSGALDEFPTLKIILGHLGEALPFLIKRIDWAWERPFDPNLRPKIAKKPSEYFKDNIFVATSGNYYEPAFMCTREAMGIDKILLGTDYPYEDPEECVDFIDRLPISQEDREKIYSENARRFGFS